MGNILEEVEERMQESEIRLEFCVAVSLKWKYSFLEVREDLIIFKEIHATYKLRDLRKLQDL